MTRLIFLAVAIALVYWLLRSFRSKADTVNPPLSSEDMVCCARCGVHLPRSECITEGENCYCCEAHRRGETTQ
ncbi:MAG: PP0621 family protein [Sideroxyarcus sp.]|nr:PP0621 family protein [Sideroxyarcus sp.]